MNIFRRFCGECKLKNDLDLHTPHEQPGERAKKDYCPRCNSVQEMVLIES